MSLMDNLNSLRQRLLGRKDQKMMILIGLILTCAGLTYYFHFILRAEVIFTHFFYVPIALAALWWGRHGAWVAALLGISSIVSDVLAGLTFPRQDDFLRAVMFIAVGLTVGFLREQALRSERKLRRTRDYLDSLIRYANAPIIVWDAERKITLFNAAFEHLTGYTADEVIGQEPGVLFPEPNQDELLSKIERSSSDEYWESVEIPILCKDGGIRMILWNLANIYAEDGKTLLATIAQGQDITLRKQVEEALHLQVEGLEDRGRITESTLEQRLAELEAYERIMDAMLHTLDLGKRLEIALGEVMNLTGAEKAGINLVEGDRLVMRKQSGFSKTYMARAGDLAVEEVPSCEEITIGWNDIPDPSSRLEAALKKERVKSWVTVPFKSEQGLLGIILLASARAQAFSSEQIGILSAVANRLTLMLEQASLYRVAQERLARLTTLREIDLAISANLSMEGIIEVVLRKVSPHIWVDAVGISLIDWERKHTVLARLHLPGDVHIEGEAFTLSESLLTQLQVEKRPVIIYDVKSDPRVQNHRHIARKYNLGSYVGVPLIVQDRAIGVLHLFTVEPRDFSQEDLDFFATMAGQAAISVHNARLYEEARRRAASIESFAQMTFDFLQVSQEEELATRILGAACEVIGAETGGLAWYNKDADILEPAAAVGISEEEKRQAKEQFLSFADPKAHPIGLAAFTRKPVYVLDASKEPMWGIDSPVIRSAYIVPLVHREHLFGVYGFLSRKVDGFSSEQRTLADTFANYVASVLDNVRLFRESRRAYEELRTTQQQLVQAQKMEAIGTLAGGVAHDFNNLLTSIQGYAQLALMQLTEDNPLYRDMKAIERNVARAANLTRQLLLFSRRQPMAMTPLDLNTVIEDMVKMLDRLIGEDTSLKTALTDGLWIIKADSGNIEQVIMNLVINARDAMPEGGEILLKTENVRVDREYCRAHTEARCGKFVSLSIKDTGSGMDAETLEHIFEPFFTTKEPGRGTGLGLAVAYGIIKQHDGWIDVESAPGQGTTFWIYLPAVSRKPVEEQETVVPLEAFRGRGERVLLVEDDESVQEFTTRVLSEHGYVVFAAADAQEALDLFAREEGIFDLLFCDVVLPDERAPRLVDRLLELRPGIRVIFTSGYTDEKSGWQAVRESGHPYLQKPYSPSDLLRIVSETLKL